MPTPQGFQGNAGTQQAQQYGGGGLTYSYTGGQQQQGTQQAYQQAYGAQQQATQQQYGGQQYVQQGGYSYTPQQGAQGAQGAQQGQQQDTRGGASYATKAQVVLEPDTAHGIPLLGVGLVGGAAVLVGGVISLVATIASRGTRTRHNARRRKRRT